MASGLSTSGVGRLRGSGARGVLRDAWSSSASSQDVGTPNIVGAREGAEQAISSIQALTACTTRTRLPGVVDPSRSAHRGAISGLLQASGAARWNGTYGARILDDTEGVDEPFEPTVTASAVSEARRVGWRESRSLPDEWWLRVFRFAANHEQPEVEVNFDRKGWFGRRRSVRRAARAAAACGYVIGAPASKRSAVVTFRRR